MDNTFNLEFLYQEYLKKVKLKEYELPPIQRKEMRQIYMAACGQMLILLRDELSKLDEDIAIQKLQSMLSQVGSYFIDKEAKQN